LIQIAAMKIFISWSGNKSKNLGIFLHEWLKSVIQAVDPWISRDIPSGSNWNAHINNNISKNDFGIICLTEENKNSRWILFEAGALAKGIENNFVSPILIDIKPENVEFPLAQFQLTKPIAEDVFKLLSTINAQLGERKLTDAQLNRAFEKNWGEFEEKITEINSITDTVKRNERSDKEILVEILSVVRDLERKKESEDIMAKLKLLRSSMSTKDGQIEVLFQGVDIPKDVRRKMDFYKGQNLTDVNIMAELLPRYPSYGKTLLEKWLQVYNDEIQT
jgi:hypothetical protein